jgi:chemotaxis protein MotB
MKKILIVMAMVGLLVGCVSTKEYRARESDIETLEQSISSLEAKISALEKENATLKDQLKAVQDEKASIEARLKSTEEDKADLQRENASLKNQLREAQDERASIEARLKSTEEDKADLQRENASLKNQLREAQDERAALEARLRKVEDEKDAFEARLKRVEDERAILEARLRRVEAEKAAVEARLRSMEEANSALRQENALLRSQVSEIARQRDAALKEKEKEVSGLKSTYDNLMRELNKEIKEGQIAITQLKDRLSLSMVEKVLFDSGSADIKKDGQKVLDRVGRILKEVKDKEISIEGHTDNVPIGLKLQQKFPTNWELSTTRATNVARYLQEIAGLNPELLIASGFSEYHPIESNDTEEGRSKNRRIEIVLTPMVLEKTAR